MKVTTNSTQSVSYMIDIIPLRPIAHYRVLLGSIVFIIICLLLLLEVINRSVVSFIGAFLTLFLLGLTAESPSLDTVIHWMDPSTLCMLFGMMVITQMLSLTGFFEYCATRLYMFSKGNLIPLHLLLCLFTAGCSVLMDSTTTMMVVAPMTIELVRSLHASPLPFLFAEIVFSNLAGTGLQIGDSSTILLGSLLNDHIQFIDFVKHCLPCVLLCMIVIYPITLLYFKKDLSESKAFSDVNFGDGYQIKNKPLCVKCGVILITVILLFFMQSWHHINISFIAVGGAFACLLLGTQEDLHTTFELLDWETLVFFAGLLIMIEGLNELGMIPALANWLISLIQHASISMQPFLAHILILWLTGILSSIVDSVTITSTMIPIIQLMSSSLHLDLSTLAWALALGASFGGNGTLIGSGANVVTVGISSANGVPISLKTYSKYGIPCTLVSLIVSTFYLWIRYLYSVYKKHVYSIYIPCCIFLFSRQ